MLKIRAVGYKENDIRQCSNRPGKGAQPNSRVVFSARNLLLPAGSYLSRERGRSSMTCPFFFEALQWRRIWEQLFSGMHARYHYNAHPQPLPLGVAGGGRLTGLP